MRHFMKFGLLHGEGRSVNFAEISHDRAKLPEVLDDYELCNIYNVEETDLFFKLLPRLKYVTTHESRSSVRGTKTMKKNDIVTPYVCTNANGACKVPMAIIGIQEAAVCLIGTTSCSIFQSEECMVRWRDVQVMVPRRVSTTHSGADVETCSTCDEQLWLSWNRHYRFMELVIIMTLPLNCTRRHQLMDLGIIAAWKVHYRQHMLCRIVADLEDRMQRREKSSNKPAGTKGMAKGYDPHMLNVAELVMQSWKFVSQIFIVFIVVG